MAVEIERKFLVKGNFKPHVFSQTRIIQGYLSSLPERVVRIRIRGEQGSITVKGVASVSGMSRYEWEKEIPVKDAHDLLNLCEPGVIDKTRYLVKVNNHTFEIDEFYGENAGLVIAEIELASENEEFIKPDWLGMEVTGDERYYNSSLVKKPFTKWSEPV